MNDVEKVQGRGPIRRRIGGSFVSVVVGWGVLVLVEVVLIVVQGYSVPVADRESWFSVQFDSLGAEAFWGGAVIAVTWVVALMPLYLFVPLKSWLWRWPVCTVCGALAGAGMMYVIARALAGPEDDDRGTVVFLCLRVGLAGGATGLFGSLTRGYFNRGEDE